MAHEKNLDFLVEVVARLRREFPDVLLVMAGEGPARPHLQSLVARLALEHNVLFVGYLQRGTELNDCYRAGDVFVFASRSETQGLVLLESLALGVPVVAIAELGTRGIVEPGRGAIAAPDDAAGFAAVVSALLHDPARRAAMSAEATEFAREWESSALARRLNAFYAALSVTAGADARIR